MEQFIVLADARTGTHYFESILNQHPDLHCFHEIFAGVDKDHFFDFLVEQIYKDKGNVHPSTWSSVFDGYLSHLFSGYSEYRAVGMDIKYYQTIWVHDLFQILKSRNIKVIHLIRKNILKHHISWVLHTKRDRIERNFHETTKVAPVKLRIDTKALMHVLQERLDRSDSYRKLLSENNLDFIEICYEDCFDNPELISQTIAPSVLDDVYDFLQIDNRLYDLKTGYIKSNPGLLSELLANYDEVVNLLNGTRWEYLLNDTIGENILDATELNEQGEALVASGKKLEAMKIFMKTVTLEPNFALGYNNIGVLLFENHDYDRSLLFFEKAINIDKDPEYTDNYHAALNCRNRNGSPNHLQSL